MHKQRWMAAGALMALVIAFGAGLMAGVSGVRSSAQEPATSSVPTITLKLGADSGKPSDLDFSQFWRTWNLLNDNFIATHASATIPTYKERLYGAIEGLVKSYGDPYTTFFPPAEAAVFQADVSGQFEGVGMEIGIEENVLVVVSPLKNSPAERAGLRSGDKIVAIDGTPAAKLAVDEAVKLIRGKAGSTVRITVMRAGESRPLEIPVVRDVIEIPTIDYRHTQNGIFEIELYNFDAISGNKFREALRALLESGDTRLLLDLRGNPGGYLEIAVDMASFFLPPGATVVTEDYRGTGTNVVHRSLGYNIFANKKLSMVILVDRGTASAAEILAGALNEHGVATLVGAGTFGKGSVQQLLDLGDGAQLKVTVARWLTPNGTNLSDGGLRPDIFATTTADEYRAGKDPQKEAAIQWLLAR